MLKSSKINRKYIYLFLVLFLLLSNIYYFFIRRGVGPNYYFNQIVFGPNDNIIELPIYQDLCEEYSLLNERYKGKKVIVFLGDSITKRFNLNEFFPGVLILNRAIFNDTTLGVINRLNTNINYLDIDKLFLMIGYNDLKYRTNTEIIQNVSYILSQARARQIYLQSLLPVTIKRKDDNQRIARLNAELRNLTDGTGYYYIDLYPRFIDEKGGLSANYSRDGVHLNASGYQLWRDTIRPMVVDDLENKGRLHTLAP